MVEAQKKYDKVVQMGNQQRSSGHSIQIMNEIHNGVIGRAYKAVAFYSNSWNKLAYPVHTMDATFEFPDDKTINWDGNSRNGYKTYGSGRGVLIYGTEGSVFLNRGHYKLFDRSGKQIQKASSSGDEQSLAVVEACPRDT